MKNKYLETFPKNEEWRYLHDRENLIAQYGNRLRIFLNQDVEDLLFKGKYEEAYIALCSKVSKDTLIHIKKGITNIKETIFLNDVEIACIKSEGQIFYPSEDNISDYFTIKANTLKDPVLVRSLQENELGRLYYLSHPEELEKANNILTSWNIY